MTQIDVTVSRQYPVRIGNGLLQTVGETVCTMTGAQCVCIVSDDNVWPIYGNIVSNRLRDNGLSVCSFVFSAGENSKNFHTFHDLLNFLAENHLSRSDCILALGGGVVGDLAGFAAATYLRGIPYIQLPTTLLAMVDSSVGGKTGIDLTVGKNLCGAFWQPAAVLCDLDVLNTLPDDIFCDGCAEVIKYALLFDPDLFSHLETTGLNFDRETVISRCITYKRDIVMLDERDADARMLLNLGHTIGHAIEKCSNYSIYHGHAVAIGIATVCRGAHFPHTNRIVTLLQQFLLPTTTHFSASALFEATLSDKKRSGNSIDLIIPDTIGRCSISNMPVTALKTLIEEGI